jgi:DNA-binding beta-propeller fold protein YncE
MKVVKTIPVGVGPHEVSVSPSGKFAAVANYGNRAGASRVYLLLMWQKKK